MSLFTVCLSTVAGFTLVSHAMAILAHHSVVDTLTKSVFDVPVCVRVNQGRGGFDVTRTGLSLSKLHDYGIPLHKGWCPLHATVHPDGKGGVRCHQYDKYFRSRKAQSLTRGCGEAQRRYKNLVVAGQPRHE